MVLRLSYLIAALAALAAAAGLLWGGGGGPFAFTTLWDRTVEIYGRGLYRRDSLFVGAGNRGTDVVTLALGIPLLLVCAHLHRRGSLRGTLLLLGTLAYFLYVYASYALGAVAYNELFLLYVGLFSASLYAFILAFRAVDAAELGQRMAVDVPRRGPALFMVASGVITLLVWGAPVVAALVTASPPARMDSYSTPVTFALDLATITPAAFTAGILILRRSPVGYLIAVSLLVLEAMLAPLIIVQTVSQLAAGVGYTPGQIIGPLAGFLVLAGLAIWYLVNILRRVA